jgi:peptidoglycan/LPS O-acetylase OafA/YrhL
LPPVHPMWRRMFGEWAHAPATCWVMAGLLYWMSTLPVAGPRNLLPASSWEWTTKHVLYGLAAFFLLLPVTLATAPWMRRLLGNPVVAWLGVVSYGVYLWHLALLMAIQRWLGWRTFGGHFWALFVLTSIAATTIAAISWYLVERPLLRRFSRPWRRSWDAVNQQQPEPDKADNLQAGAVDLGR